MLDCSKQTTCMHVMYTLLSDCAEPANVNNDNVSCTPATIACVTFKSKFLSELNCADVAGGALGFNGSIA